MSAPVKLLKIYRSGLINTNKEKESISLRQSYHIAVSALISVYLGASIISISARSTGPFTHRIVSPG